MWTAESLPALGRWLAVASSHLASSLVDEQARTRLEATARRLLADDLGIIEVRLAADKPELDLSVRLSQQDQSRPIGGQLSRSFAQQILSHWAEQGPNCEQIPALWLEFDLDQEHSSLPPPLIIAQLRPDTDPLGLADTLLPALHGRPLTPAQRETVLLGARAVPPPARLLYAFSLLSRPGNAVRLEILGLGPAEARDYLSLIAPHTLPTLAKIAPLLAGTENPHLSFDIGEAGQVLPRIGLEGAFRRQPSLEPRWARLLSRWVDLGLCSPEKRDAVLAWPGQDSYWSAPERWPAEAGIGGRLVRFLSHLKVVGEPGQPPQAKAYLGLRYLPPPSSML